MLNERTKSINNSPKGNDLDRIAMAMARYQRWANSDNDEMKNKIRMI